MELPNLSYYLDKIGNKYLKCHEKCKMCYGPNKNNCISYNNKEKYFSKTKIRKLCTGGNYPKEDTYGYSSHFPDNYYLDTNVCKYKQCHPNCDSCSNGYISGVMHCTSCSGERYFDDEITTNCVDDDPNCDKGCAKCETIKISYLNQEIIKKICKRCSFKKRYYPLEKYLTNQNYVSCYQYKHSPIYYYYNIYQQIHKLCYKSCYNCSRDGNNINHNCESCFNNYRFIEDFPKNCYPKCSYYYYFNKFNEYKCTKNNKCPDKYPFLVFKKGKCVHSCLEDNKYKRAFKNYCYEKCPYGTSELNYTYNGKVVNIECIECIKCIESINCNDCKKCMENINNNAKNGNCTINNGNMNNSQYNQTLYDIVLDYFLLTEYNRTEKLTNDLEQLLA